MGNFNLKVILKNEYIVQNFLCTYTVKSVNTHSEIEIYTQPHIYIHLLYIIITTCNDNFIYCVNTHTKYYYC